MTEFFVRDGQCGVELVFKIIGARWKPRILELCYLQKGVTLSALNKDMPKCTDVMLTRQLKGLIADGILQRTNDRSDLKAGEYVLTERARDLMPVMVKMQELTYLCDYPSSGYEYAVEYANKLIGGKWRSRIIWVIHASGMLRFNQILRSVEGISHKILIEQLTELYGFQLINKIDYQEKSPHVEYSLTPTGEKAYQIIKEVANWCHKYDLLHVQVALSI